MKHTQFVIYREDIMICTFDLIHKKSDIKLGVMRKPFVNYDVVVQVYILERMDLSEVMSRLTF
jgi:uncharacterized protein YjaZ